MKKNQRKLFYPKKNVTDAYIFKTNSSNQNHDIVHRRGDEPDFKINDELYAFVYEDMPQELSLEEKAVFIYCKLCEALNFDGSYLYRRKLNENEYSSEFDQERVESIKPYSDVLTFDFARIYAEFVNELGDGIEAVTIETENSDWLTGFYTENVSVELDPFFIDQINAIDDIIRMKTGIYPRGWRAIDEDNIMHEIFLDMCTLTFKQGPRVDLNEYVFHCEQAYCPSFDENFENRLNVLTQIFKNSNIKGSEAIVLLLGFDNCGFLPGGFSETYVGKKQNQNGKEVYKRQLLMQRKSEKDKVYIFDSENLNIDIKRYKRSKTEY